MWVDVGSRRSHARRIIDRGKKVDKLVLSQYIDLQAEVNDLQKQIQRIEKELDKMEKDGIQESDIVKGTRTDGTYGTIKVTGFPLPRWEQTRLHLRRRKEKLQEAYDRYLEVTNQVEEYLESLDDFRMKRILQYRFLDGLSWGEVAMKMGKKYSADSCRKQVERFYQKN